MSEATRRNASAQQRRSASLPAMKQTSTTIDDIQGQDRAKPGGAADSVVTIRAISWVRESWHIVAVLLAFVISMFIVPTMLNVSVGDDWVYTRSVEILLQEGRIEILDLSVVTLIFQVFWGALFSLLFGTSFGAMRLSTAVLVLGSGFAMYGLCLELGIRKSMAALGAALYLFNPLTYVLAFTFMTDPQFTALMVIASYFYIRGLNLDRLSPNDVIAGSALAACAFLVRQQGVLIPLAVGVYLLGARRWKFDRAGLVTAIHVAGIPAITMVLYYFWILFSHGAPEQQGEFIDQIRSTGWQSTRLLTYRMTYIELAYVGFFVLPVFFAAIWYFLRAPNSRIDRNLQALRWFVLTMLMVAGAMIAFGSANSLMPFISQYLGIHGLGPQDLYGDRDLLVSEPMRRLITYAIFGSSALFLIVVSRRFGKGFSSERATASLIGSLAIWQIIGIMPPSFHFANWIISVDRYLLPILPFAVCLMLWAVKDMRLSMPVAWIVAGLLALYSIMGTRDFLVLQDATWDMGRVALSVGVPIDSLDAGAAWGGYYLYDFGMEYGIETRSPPGSPWWTDLFAKATDSSYLVGTSAADGWTVIAQEEYSSWLHDEPQYMYLMRRPEVPGPP